MTEKLLAVRGEATQAIHSIGYSSEEGVLRPGGDPEEAPEESTSAAVGVVAGSVPTLVQLRFAHGTLAVVLNDDMLGGDTEIPVLDVTLSAADITVGLGYQALALTLAQTLAQTLVQTMKGETNSGFCL